MRNSVWICLLVGAWMLLPSASPAAEIMKPGLWEISTSMEMPGMPFQPPPQTIQHCYTAEDVKQNQVPTMDNDCKVTDLETAGNKTSWKIECTGEMAGKGEGEITSMGDSAYAGTSSIQTQGMTMVTKYKGKRLGECK